MTRPGRAGGLASAGRKPARKRLTRKGGPIPGTPSPTRTRMTPELQAHVKRRYEETDQPVCQIALDVGINESVIRRMGPREGWVRYVAPPRDLPPLATLLAEVEALDSQSSPPSFEGGLRPPPQDEAEKSSASRDDNIARFIRIVMAHLDEFEAVRRDGKLLPKHHLQTARAISILTEAFNRLQRLRASSNGSIHDDISDMPADLDAYRLELARQIDAFIESRTNAGVVEDGVAAPVDGA